MQRINTYIMQFITIFCIGGMPHNSYSLRNPFNYGEDEIIAQASWSEGKKVIVYDSGIYRKIDPSTFES